MSNDTKVSNAGKPQWMLFLALSYLLIMGYLYFVNPAKKAGQNAGSNGASQTSGTLVSSLDRSTSDTLGADASSTGTTPAAANTSGGLQGHPGELTTLRTDNYDIQLDSIGGVVHNWRLLDTGSQSFDKSVNTTGVEMVQRIPSANGEPVQQNWPLEISFKEQQVRSYEDLNHVPWTHEIIGGEGDTPAVRLKSPAIQGLRVEKTLETPKDSFYSTLRITVVNENNSKISVADEYNRGLTLRWGPGLVARDLADPDTSSHVDDAAVLRDFKEVKVFRPKVDGDVLEADGTLQWAGVESKFFAALLVPPQPDDAANRQHYYFRTLVPNSYKVNALLAGDINRQGELERYHPPLMMELSTGKFDLAAGDSRTFEFGVYVGPKKHAILKKYDKDLENLMFSESWWWMRAIYLALTDLLNWIHRIVGNYGIAIMLLTVIVKLLVFPLVLRSIKIQGKSSAEMKRIKPHLEAINEKYKEDPQEKQRQTWKVYQEHGINPLGMMRSCLPVLPQIPIFIGLYKIAQYTIDLQGAHFLWIKDLSQADHFLHFGSHLPLIGSYLNLLPFMVAVSQIFSSKISLSRSIQNITDENQRQMQKMMVYLIPVMVLVTMYHFPSGLMLYWIASNTWQIGQTLITNRILDREEEKHLKAGPPPRKAKKAADPNSFMGKLMARAEVARKEMERREQEMKKKSGSNTGRKK